MKHFKTLILISLFLAGTPVLAEQLKAVVYKTATCGCCKKWVKHLENNGFTVEAHDVEDLVPYKIKGGVTPQLASCHTAYIGGYTVEGHVPAEDIKLLLKTQPKVTGIAVPGMPVGTPGMEMGNRNDPYHVIAFDREAYYVFSSYPAEK
jgi:hypothetical protein